MKGVRKVLYAGMLAAFACLDSIPAYAQQAAYAMHTLSPAERSRELSKRAIECLRRGEDADDPQVKRQAYTEGLELARQAVAADDSNADGHFAVFACNGRLLLLNGTAVNPINLYRASAELERTLEIDPNHADALAAKGGLYRQLPWPLGGNLDKAEELLSRAIELNPNAVGARIELAQVYRKRGDTRRGLLLLEKAAEIAERQGKKRQLAEARRLLEEFASAEGVGDQR